MKKKLLPFILGCAVMSALPMAVNAEKYYHTGTDIETNGNTTTYADWNENSASKPTPTQDDPPRNVDGHNEFTEYNDGATSTQNTLAKTFTGSTTASGSGLGNTRQTAASMQSITNKNEQQDYRSSDTATTLAQDLAANNFNEQTNDTAGTTDLETAISEFNMTIPASTVLPIGATRWRIGNVKIDGEDFVRPDKVKLSITKQNFHHENYDSSAQDGESADVNVNKVIAFDVTDRRYTSSSIVGTGHETYFFQNGAIAGAGGASTMQTSFPYSFEGYTSTDYQAGLTSDIHETHQIWVLAAASAWSGKTAGRYTGSITFTATVDTTDNASMYSNLYPGEGQESNS